MTKNKYIYNIKKFWYNNGKIYKLEWIILSIVAFFAFFSYFYGDIILTTSHGFGVWESLFNGSISDYYYDMENRLVNFYSGSCFSSAIYPFPLYIVFAIWNLPLYIIKCFWGIDPTTSRLLLAYAKSILILFLLGSAMIIYKICKNIGIDNIKSKWCVFYFLSSSFVIFPLLIQSQYDIISVFFTLLGLLYYIKNDQKKFVLFFALAITMKLFALFIFVPLVLLKEKKIFKILFYSIAGISILVAQGIIFKKPESAEGCANNMIGYIFSGKICDASIFIILLFCLCVYCYFKKESTKEFSILVAFAGMGSFFLFSFAHPYWIILLCPYLSILVFAFPEYIKINCILETILSLSCIFHYTLTIPHCFSINVIKPSLFSKFFGEPSAEYFAGANKGLNFILEKLIGNETFFSFANPTFFSIFVGAMICFFVGNYFAINKKENLKTNSIEKQQMLDVNIRTLIWTRFIINFGVGFSILALYIFFMLK